VRTTLLAGAIWFLLGERALGQQAVPSSALLEVRQKLPAALAPSQAATVEIQVVNRGGSAAENVIVTASMPNSWEFLDADPVPERGAGSSCWRLGAIEASGSRLLRVRLTPATGERASAELRSDVRVTYQASAASGNVVAVQRPSLALHVTGPDSTPPGEAASLVITVANNGSASAEEVTLQTILPPGLSHPGGNDLEKEVGTLKPGETRSVMLIVTPARAGEFRTRIRATVAGAPAAEGESLLSVPAFKLAVEANGPRLLYPEWTGTFEVVIRNDDALPAEQVAVAIGLPSGLAVVRAGDDGQYDGKAHVLRWNLRGLNPGETRTLVWSGVARAVGEQACQVQVTAGLRGRKTLSWRTVVADAPPASLSGGTTASPAPQASSHSIIGNESWRNGNVVAAGRVAPAVLRFDPEEPAARQPAADRR
jgi:hypothetical protein